MTTTGKPAVKKSMVQRTRIKLGIKKPYDLYGVFQLVLVNYRR